MPDPRDKVPPLPASMRITDPSGKPTNTFHRYINQSFQTLDRHDTRIDSAQADAAAALAVVGAAGSDGVLTINEKYTVIKPAYNALVAEHSDLDTTATSYAGFVDTEKGTYDAAYSALLTYLGTLTTPVLWSDESDNTAVDRDTWRTKWDAVTSSRQLLINAIHRRARYVDFSEGVHTNKHLDNIADGTTHGRVKNTHLNANRPIVDLADSFHLNKNHDNIADGTTYKRYSGTEKTRLAGMEDNATKSNVYRQTTAPSSPGLNDTWVDTSVTPRVVKHWNGTAWVADATNVTNADEIGDGTTYGRVKNTHLNSNRPVVDFSDSFHSNKHLDNIADGTTYGRPLASRLNAGKPVIDFAEGIHSNKSLANVDSTANTKLGTIRDYAGKVLDTRSTDELPSYYYALGLGVLHEFKNANFSGSGSSGYGNLTTTTQWTDASGGPVQQTLTDSTGVIFQRISTDSSTWGTWAKHYTALNKPNLDNDVLDGTTYGRIKNTHLDTGRPKVDFADTFHSNKSLANIDGTANTKLSGIEANATAGATWGTNVSGRPTELTDGRITAGLDASGLIDFSRGHANKSLANIDSTADTKLGGIASGATKNIVSYGTTAPSSPVNGDIWVDTSDGGYQQVKVRVSGAWQLSAAYGAQTGRNIYDSVGATLADAHIKNSAVTLSAAGVLSGAGGGSIAYDSLADGTTYGKIKKTQLSSGNIAYDNVSDGATYAKMKAIDLSSGFHKLTIGTSGLQIGDARNLPPVKGANLGYKYSGTLSIGTVTTTSAAISITAGSVTAGSATVSYNAMSKTISGLTASTFYTYYFYVSDTGYAGGTKTLLATTDNLTPYSNDAYVFMGSASFTTPASGTQTGGGTGGGTYTGGGGCVHANSWVETMESGWKRARDVVPGDMLRVLTDDREDTEFMPVLSNRIMPENGYEITSESGVTLRCSNSTPLTLRDGSNIFLNDLNGQELPVYVDGKLSWEPCLAKFKGAMPVCYISMGGLVYAAGMKKGLSILTHNIVSGASPKP